MALTEPRQFIAPLKPQFQLVVRTFAPFARFSGFEGDNRSFSTSSMVSYRTGAFLTFDLSKGRIIEGPTGDSSGTRRYSNEPKYYTFPRVVLKHPEGSPGRITFAIHLSGSNPGAEGKWGRFVALTSPNIDTELEFTAFLNEGNLFAAGQLTCDAFPSTEVFLRDNNRQGHMLYMFATPHGRVMGPLLRLPYVGTRSLGTFKEGIALDNRMHFIGSSRWKR
jgi:hypothetical protein